MSEETQGKRGEAAWKEQRDAIAQRNAATQRRAQAEQKTRGSVIDDRIRQQSQRERQQLEELNAQIDGRRPAGGAG